MTQNSGYQQGLAEFINTTKQDGSDREPRDVLASANCCHEVYVVVDRTEWGNTGMHARLRQI